MAEIKAKLEVLIAVKLLTATECLQIHFGRFSDKLLLEVGIYDLTTDVMHDGTAVLCKYGIIFK